jgi:Uma2 family endonuclease
MTIRHEDLARGLEPDSCFYLAGWPRIRGRRGLDFRTDPPPDLAIEIDLRRSNLRKLGIYGTLEIPEVWSHDGQRVVVHLLGLSGDYQTSERSAAFPGLAISELPRFLSRIGRESETGIVRAFREWVRGGLAP